MAWGENNNKGPWGNVGGKKPADNKNAGEKKQTAYKPEANSGSGGGGDKIIDIDKLFRTPNGKGNGSAYYGGGKGNYFINAKILMTIIILALVGWGLTGFYKVDASEEGVVLRFGKYNRTASEGLRYHLPSPIEQVFIVKKTRINSIEVGFRSNKNSSRGYRNYNYSSKEQKNPSESLMLTGDTNIADVSFVVQWRIKNSFKYLFNITNPNETVKAVSESAMREVIGKSYFAEAMTTKRNQIERDVESLIQSTLDSYNAGIEIYVVNLNDVQNPSPVMPAFLDVETAKQDMETAINKAKSYENDIVPKARGEARKIIQDAEAYRKEVVSIAEGNAARFESVYDEYRKAKDVTKKRIYLETMEDILKHTQKIIMDSKAGNNVLPYLPLNGLQNK